jgi:hypothetical protein
MQAANVLPGGVIHPVSMGRFCLAVVGQLIALGGILTVLRLPLLVTFAMFLLGIGIATFATRGFPSTTAQRLTKREWFAFVGGMVAVLVVLITLGEIFGEETVKNWPLHPIAYIVGWSTVFHAARQLRGLASHLSCEPTAA